MEIIGDVSNNCFLLRLIILKCHNRTIVSEGFLSINIEWEFYIEFKSAVDRLKLLRTNCNLNDFPRLIIRLLSI